MSKKHYILLIFFLGLSAAIVLLQSSIRVQLGPEIFLLDSFGKWFLVTQIISLAGATLLLKYYQHQQYRFVFITGIISLISTFCYAILVYIMVEFQQLGSYNLPVLLLYTGTAIVYATGLIFLPSEKKYWLKLSGFVMLVLELVLLSTITWGIYHPAFVINNTFETIVQWTSLASSLIPVLLIIHFLSERRKLNTGNTNMPVQQRLENVWSIAGMVSFLLTLTFGSMLFLEYRSKQYWAQQNYTKTKQLAQLADVSIFVNSKGETLLYRLIKPLDYDSTKKYPLVVSLPYGGQPATDTIRQIEGAAAAELLLTDSNRKKYPAFIFIPHCPPGSGWGGIPDYPQVDSLVYDAISSLDEQFAIDTKRRYVTGISRGGYGTWHFICTRPDMFAAAIPVSGGEDPELAPKAVNVAVWAFHGRNDKNVPVSSSRNMISAIKRAGGNPEYTEFPDEGHSIWYNVSITPGLLDWLFAQKRE